MVCGAGIHGPAAAGRMAKGGGVLWWLTGVDREGRTEDGQAVGQDQRVAEAGDQLCGDHHGGGVDGRGPAARPPAAGWTG
jgi:hypothetical protein